ncbi:MAG: hypothetical protein LBT98_03465 [Puniceicoccales bacterium]|jgi:hypothetical protein|nr:hypothetical protein [Puniceicoccales bacterium]
MREERANQLEVNFVSRAWVNAANSLDHRKLWLMEADAVVETWQSSDGETMARRYASGWQEIRGWRAGSGDSLITFPFPFKSVREFWIGLTVSGTGYAYYTDQTESSIHIVAPSTSSNGVVWYAIGMGAN